MYKLVIQLVEVDKNIPIHEIISPHYHSIQECFEQIESGKELFEGYLAIERRVMKQIGEVLSRCDNLTKQDESS